jgi:hypothetical protein
VANIAASPYPRFKAFYPGTGNPLAGGQLYTLLPGTSCQFGLAPPYPQPTYTTSTGTAANSNPVILDSNGEADVWLSGYTKMVLYDINGNLIWSVDNVSAQPQIQSSAIQWVNQGAPLAFISATQFSVLGNQTSLYVPGTAIQATITGGQIYGIVSASSYSGSPVITIVTVVWFSTALNASVTGIATGVIAAPITTAGSPFSWAQPVMPVVDHPIGVTAYTILPTDLFQIHTFAYATPSITLPAANSIPSGSWVTIKNLGSGNLTITTAVDGVANSTYAIYKVVTVYADGTYGYWYIR